jgi:hypothetical protein
LALNSPSRASEHLGQTGPSWRAFENRMPISQK